MWPLHGNSHLLSSDLDLPRLSSNILLHIITLALSFFNCCLLHLSIRQLDDILFITIEEFCHFLQRRIARLDQLRPDEPTLEHQERAVNDVIAPRNVLECDWIDELVEEESAQNREAADDTTFSAQAIW